MITNALLSQYQTFPMLTVANDENTKQNGSIFVIGKDDQSKKNELVSNDDSNSNCSSEDNVFREANCYILYLFGKALQSATTSIQSVSKCQRIWASVS